jgi:hypothetical protein
MSMIGNTLGRYRVGEQLLSGIPVEENAYIESH